MEKNLKIETLRFEKVDGWFCGLYYIHKQKDGKDIYFFANSTDSFVETDVRLKGKLSLEIWNPYTGDLGKEIPVKYEIGNDNIVYTTFRLQLSPVKSIFIIGDK